MQLGSVYSEKKSFKTINRFLHVIGMAVLFLTFSSFSSIPAIAEIIPTSDNVQNSALQSSHSERLEKEALFLVALEAEELEESEEEKKDGSSDTFAFYASTNLSACQSRALIVAFSPDSRLVPLPKVPLYLLFHNLRIHLS